MRQFVAHNRMLQGGFVIEDRTVTLADISVPVLTVIGEVDEIAPTAAVRAVHRAAPRAEIYETSMRAGHFGLVVGSKAATVTWPTVAAWALWRDGNGEQPDNVARAQDGEEPQADTVPSSERAAFTMNLAANVSFNMARSVVGTVVDTAKSAQSLTGQAVAQLPRLARLEQVDHNTRISMGTLLDEQATRHPGDPFFRFEGRSHTYADAKVRIDNVVKGLISVGVRQGEHVGVLMDTRPSGLAAVAALSRLGAIAVMLRPGPDIAREVRRYGVTVVSYTWTLVRDLVEAPPDPAERHHPVRMFMGSGMPAGLWKQVMGRFAPATVLEFYGSTEGSAVLVNLNGRKVGSKGRPLPGSAEVRLARYDTVGERLVEGPDGFAIECDVGETGVLLAQARRSSGIMATTPLRGLFRRNDSWIATDDLFHRDEDGDFWLDDHVPAVIHTAQGTVPSVPIEDALGQLDEVSLAVAYGVTSTQVGVDPGAELVVAAVTRSAGLELDSTKLSQALDVLPLAERPSVIHVVDDIERTAWFRLRKFALREAGLPSGGVRFHLDQKSGAYALSS